MNSSSNFLGAIADQIGAPDYLDRTYGRPLFHTESEVIAVRFDGEGNLWSIEECGLLRNWTAGGRQLGRVYLSDLETVWEFSADARYLASGSEEVHLWDVYSGQSLSKTDVGIWTTAIAFSPDGTLLASGHDDGTVCVWETHGLKLRKKLPAHPTAISALAFRGNVELASAGEDRKIRVWNLQTFQQAAVMTGHPDRIPALIYHPQGEQLLSAGWDRSVRIWKSPQADPLMLLNTHSEQVYCLAYSADGKFLACADSDYEVHLWTDLQGKQPANILRGHEAEIAGMTFSPDGQFFASAGADRTIHVWNLATGALHAGPQSGNRHTIALAAGPTRSNLVSALGTSLQAWEPESASMAWFPPATEPMRSLAASADGHWLALSGETPDVELWDISTHQKARVLTHTKGPISDLAFSPDSKRLATASLSDGLVWLWDMAEPEAILVIPEAADSCTLETVVFHPKENLIAVGGIDFLSTGGTDGAVCLWDLDKREKLKGFERGVTCLAFDPKCRYLAGGTLANSVAVWDLQDDKLVFDLPGHTERIGAVAFSPDGSWLVSASDDCTIRVWNVLNGRLVVARHFDTAIQSLVFGADGEYLYTGNADSTCYRLNVGRLFEE